MNRRSIYSVITAAVIVATACTPPESPDAGTPEAALESSASTSTAPIKFLSVSLYQIDRLKKIPMTRLAISTTGTIRTPSLKSEPINRMK